ncbi:alpha/beta hydrolase family protein [Myroides injenensis]|uniref:alpha/beta hydrolase family protein n=1 Tax=Myroides injenensis TaxID=1183151 RepID=UPI00028A2AF6|nr:prolyl oligopeptidase family serine peptidase [Myroides injenensis]
MNIKIRLVLFFILIICPCAQLKGQIIKDSIYYTELNNAFLTKGNKIIITKHYKFNSNNDSLFIYNTDGKILLKEKYGSMYKDYNENLVKYNSDNKTIEILNIDSFKKQIIKNVIDVQFIEDNNLLLYVDNTTDSYHLIKVLKNSFKIIWTYKKSDINTIKINDNKQVILFQYKKLDKGIGIINLKNLKIDYNTQVKDSIKHIIWDKKFHIAFLTPNLLSQNNYPFIYFFNYFDNIIHKQTLNSESSYRDFEALNKESFKVISQSIPFSKPYNVNELELWSTKDLKLNHTISSSSIQEQSIQGHIIFNYQNKKVYQPQSLSHHESVRINENTFLIFDSNQYLNYSYLNSARPRDIKLFNITENKETLIVKAQTNTVNTTSLSPNGSFFVFIKNNILYIYDTKNKKLDNKIEIIDDDLKLRSFIEKIRIWSKDEKHFYFVSNSSLMRYNTKTKKTDTLISGENFIKRYKILNKLEESKFNSNNEIHSKSIIDNKLLINTYDINNTYFSLLVLENNKQIEIIKNTKDHISNVKYSKDFKTITYTLENYNKPKAIYLFDNGKTKSLLKSDMPKNLYEWKKQKIVSYKDKYGNNLKGILYYPKNFDTNKKYSMITYIYEMQNQDANKFTYPSYLNGNGFNLDIYLENDYFVFYPDILTTKQGPGLSALNCIQEALKIVLKKENSINPEKLGLMGYSFGGYETNFIITQTNLFKTAVSGSGPTDLISFYFSYLYGYNTPNIALFENGQFAIPFDFSKNKKLYLDNSPILFADKVTTPLLTFTGDKDKIVDKKQHQELFIAMLRYHKPHIALFYKNEGHVFQKKENQIDITKRVMNWFDYYLKDLDNKETFWIKYNTTFEKDRILE